MIIYSEGFVLSEAAAGQPLAYPRILYANRLKDLSPSAVTVSSESVDGPKDAPLRPDTGESWLPTSLPATYLVDLGDVYDIEGVGIAGHTLGTNGCSVEIAVSADDDVGSRLYLPGETGDYASTPDSAALDITGDLDLRSRIRAVDYTGAAEQVVLSKWMTTGNQRSYRLSIKTDGSLRLGWSTDGTAETFKDSTTPLVTADGVITWVRATLDVDNGAAGNDVKFYTSNDYNPETETGTWNQLGTTVTTGGVTSIFSSSAAVNVSGHDNGTLLPFAGKVYWSEIRNGIGGAIAAEFDPARGSNLGTSLTSETSEVWTINQNGVSKALLEVVRFAEIYSPLDDAPLLFLDADRIGRYLLIRVTGDGEAPRIASIYAGSVLAMEKMVSGPFTPISMGRVTELYQSLSRGGQVLGQNFRRLGVQSSITFKNLTAAWVRQYFEPFAKSARSLPFFIAWNPEEYPEEVGYCWAESDITPRYSGLMDLMDVSWSMSGTGNE